MIRRGPVPTKHTFFGRHRWLILSLLFAGIVILSFSLWQYSRPSYDLVIRGGRIFDGSKFLTLPRDVGIQKGRVAAIGFLFGVRANRTIDARGRVVAPGFIDTHVHVESSMIIGRSLRAPNFVKMGVTTVVTGNCGTSHARLRDVLDSLEQHGGHVNVLTLVGHNTIRERVMGQGPGVPSDERLRSMNDLVEDAMRAGAFGLSTGLQYAPGTYAADSEIVTLAKIAAKYDGIYATHVRDEGSGLMTSLEEAVSIAEEARIPLHVSHLKIAAREDWGKMPNVLSYLNSVRPRLPALTHDVYAYTRSSSSLDLLLPAEFRGMLGHARRIVADPDQRDQLVRGMLKQLHADHFRDYQYAKIAWFRDERFWGKDIPALEVPAEWREQNAWVQNIVSDKNLEQQLQNVLYVFTHGGAQMIYEVMDDADVVAALRAPDASIGSDSGVRTKELTTAHPRSVGNFPKIIGEMVRNGTLKLDEALRKMTLQPALTFGLTDRGRLQEGMPADIVVFDPKTVSGPADYNDLQDPRGIDFVIVNGEIVAQDGRVEEKFPGKPIRKRNERPLNTMPPTTKLHASHQTTAAVDRKAVKKSRKVAP